MSHTPGPWTVVDDSDGAGRCFQVEGPTLTDGFSGGYRWFTEADARLIAAAPELLALAHGIEWLATGGTERNGVYFRPTDGDWHRLVETTRALVAKIEAK